MSNLSITQSYILCALNSKGTLPALSMEIPVCVVAGSVLDLILENSVTILDKKLDAVSPPGSQLQYLHSIYDFIAEKGGIKLDALASEYCFSISSKRFNTLIHAVGESLNQKQCVTSHQGGLLGNKEIFIPNQTAVDGVVQRIRAEILEDRALSNEITALVSLLQKSGILKKYFSSPEKKLLKTRIDEIKHSPSYKIASELVDYITVTTTLIVTCAQ